MKKSIKLGLVASALMTVSGLVFAQATDIKLVDPRESPYVIDPRGVIVKDPFGLCWRTGQWSVERAAAAKIENAKFPNWTAGCECDQRSDEGAGLRTAAAAAAAGRCADAASPAAAGSPGPDERKGDVRR